ncbi:MAG: phosphopyruvate hydratase [Candidatus Woesearchaeota archaeon]
MKIEKIHARQVLDSRGNPTIEAIMKTKNSLVSAIVPSGASTGAHEALELRDNQKVYHGKSVTKAINNVNKKIYSLLKNKIITNQKQVDELLIKEDNTVNKSRFGANSILSVSMCTTRALSTENKIQLYKYIAKIFQTKKIILPKVYANVINGGVHAGNELEIQEFMIVPTNAKTFSESIQMVAETYQTLKEIIKNKYGKNAINVGDEGGFAPPISTAEQALDLLTLAIKQAKYEGKLKIAIDAAASEFYNIKTKTYTKQKLTSKQLEEYYVKLIKKYPIVSLEDPFEQDDFQAWKSITNNKTIKQKKVQIVGDDLTVSNPARVQFAIDNKLCNALLLKINQIGTITEALLAAKTAMDAGWNVMVSHRSGETEDTFIADLAVGLSCGQLKLGAPCRTERVAKYNQLLRIEEELGK